MIPAVISKTPSILARESGSLKRAELRNSTNTKAKLIKGYAKLSSNFVKAPTQQTNAKKPPKSPLSTQGLKIKERKNGILWESVTGTAPARATCHLSTSWPYTVNKIVPSTYANPAKL